MITNSSGLFQYTGGTTMANVYQTSSSPWASQGVIAQPIIGAVGSSSITTPSLTTLSIGEIEQMINQNVKKYEIYELKEDLLTLSCVWYRMRKNRLPSKPIGVSGIAGLVLHPTPTKLIDNVLFQNITAEDRELSKNIRDYYSKKIMMLKLKDVKLTKYRDDLNNFIHSDGTKVQENIFGLAYRLPEFYDYDMRFDSLIENCDKEIKNKKEPKTSQQTLTFLGKLQVDRKTTKRVEYWFKNNDNNLTNICIEPNNPLLKVWDRVVSEEITLEGNYFVKLRDNIEYYSIKNYSLV